LSVSVNIAPRDLQRADFVERLKARLAQHPELPAGCLELEILESAAIENTEHARAVISECQSLGVKFSLDDFGTGYASLAYLKQIPADILKIDQNFVRDILADKDDLALVQGVVGLAAAFGREVIAEGMETHEHGVVLMRLGCDRAQGYGLARPMPLREFEAWRTHFQPNALWRIWAGTQWPLEDFALLMAEQDHLDWIQKLVAFVEGGPMQLFPAELTDLHSCRFGHWCDSSGRQRYGHLPVFKELDGIHGRVHALGSEMANWARQGQTDKARDAVPELLALKAAIQTILGQLHREAANHRNTLR
jgi:hypothetical protein